MKWKDNFSQGAEIVVCTSCEDGMPHANVVISLGFVGDKLLIANSKMHTTAHNLKRNKQVCVVAGYIRIKGTVETYTSGDVFDLCVKKTHGYVMKSAMLITITDVFDLDNVCKLR